MKHLIFFTTFFVAADLFAADLFLKPPGVEPGERYRLIFTTSEKRDATSSNIEVYNEFVQSVADQSPVVGSWGLEWRALASTQDVDARDNTNTNPFTDELFPIFRVDGEPFTTDPRLMYSEGPELSGGPSLNRVEVTELGTKPTTPEEFNMDFIGGVGVWTGTDINGRAAIANVMDLPLYLGSLSANASDSFNGSDSIFQDGIVNTDVELHFYAISEVITAVPEPNCLSITAFLGFAIFVRSASRGRTVDVSVECGS